MCGVLLMRCLANRIPLTLCLSETLRWLKVSRNKSSRMNKKIKAGIENAQTQGLKLRKAMNSQTPSN